jgi:hypothetical protein
MSVETIRAVTEAVSTYFSALYECDLQKFDQAFHPSASLFDWSDGQFTAMPIAEYRAIIAQRLPPQRTGQQREDELITLDLLSHDAAVAKVRLRVHDKVFVDHLSFVRTGGRFQIVAKVWHDATGELASLTPVGPGKT